MKLILDKDGVKREIEGPFQLCLSNEDARKLVAILERRGEKFVYGWLDVTEFAESTVNQLPRKWTD